MPRVVNEIQEGNLRPTARPQDVYYRPAVGPESRLEKIAGAFVGIDASLGQYLKKKADAQWESDLATGVELFKRASVAAGRTNLTEQEVKQMLDEGKIEGFARYTKGVKQGVIKQHYEEVRNDMFQKVVSEFPTMTVTDDNGNQIPLEQSNDYDKVSTAIRNKITGYMLERTGGVYDPRLYAEYIQPGENSIMERFIQQQAGARAKMLILEQQKVLTQGLDNVFTKASANGWLALPYQEGGRLVADEIHGKLEQMVANGMHYADARETVQRFLRSAMSNPDIPEEYIDAIYHAALQVPEFVDDVEFRQQMDIGLGQAHEVAMYRRRREDERGRSAAEQYAYEFGQEYFLGDKRLTPEVMSAALEKVPWEYRSTFTKTLNSLRRMQDMSLEMTQEMPSDEFRKWEEEACYGRLTFNAISGLYLQGMLSQEQANSLLAWSSHAHSAINSQIQSGLSANKARTKREKSIENMQKLIVDDWIHPEIQTGDDKDAIKTALVSEAAQLADFDAANAAAGMNYTERQRQLRLKVMEIRTNHKDSLVAYKGDPYAADLPQDDRTRKALRMTMGATIESVLPYEKYSADIRNGVRAYVEAGDVKGLENYIRKHNPTAPNPAQTAKNLIAYSQQMTAIGEAQEGGTSNASND